MAEEIVKKLIILESMNYKKTRKMAKKMGIFRKKIFLHFFGIKIVFLSKFHSPRCCNGLNFRKKHEKSIFVKHGKKP